MLTRIRAFTLIELLIVVIVIAILATFAIPQYLKAVERAKGAKAQNNMSILRKAEAHYRADNDTYVFCLGGSGFGGGCNPVLGDYIEVTDVDSDQDWVYLSLGWGAALNIIALRTADQIIGKV